MTQTFEPLPDFNALGEEAQRQVAERLLRIEQSNWRPFWCPDPECPGDPHPLVDEITGEWSWIVEGACTQVSTHDFRGPLGQRVSEDVYDDEDGSPLGRYVIDTAGGWDHNHARVDQRLPYWGDPWTLFIMSGRGSGKTRVGVEFVTLCARKGLNGIIVGRRGNELENTHVAELIKFAHPDFMPEYKASKDLLLWPNGAITWLFSAERPENIRSVNASYCWFDEAAFMDEVETAWMNAELATRIETPGNPLHFLITSTPTSTKWVMDKEDEGKDPDSNVIVRRVSTYANKKNLAESFIDTLEKKYKGTRMGRQEIEGEVLRDVEGALWNDDLFHHNRFTDADKFDAFLETLDDRVLAVDPAGSKGPRSDATGIIGAGRIDADEAAGVSRYSVLADATIKGTPTQWARQTFKAARMIKASRIIVEKNFGGAMVIQVLNDFADKYPAEALDHEGEPYRILERHAVQGKETRAEGTVAKYEQGRVDHCPNPTVFGDLGDLEKEQVGWVPKSRGGRHPSPNRIDALVWAMRDLETQVIHKADTATGREVMGKIKGVRSQGGSRTRSGWGMPAA